MLPSDDGCDPEPLLSTSVIPETSGSPFQRGPPTRSRGGRRMGSANWWIWEMICPCHEMKCHERWILLKKNRSAFKIKCKWSGFLNRLSGMDPCFIESIHDNCQLLLRRREVMAYLSVISINTSRSQLLHSQKLTIDWVFWDTKAFN